MVKKLKSTGQRFSLASKQARAAERDARAREKEERERMLAESVVPADILAPLPAESWLRVTHAQLDDEVVAIITRSEGSNVVGVTLTDDEGTHIELRHVEECRQVLTFHSVAIARMFPGGGARLAARVRQREVEAEAQQICAVAGQPATKSHTTRL